MAGLKKRNMSTFRRINNWLHLWLGLVSGIIMLVVCLMACLWVFQEEIGNLVYPPIKVEQRSGPLMAPSGLLSLADSLYPGEYVRFINYRQGEPVAVGMRKWDNKPFDLLLNPYSGHVYGKAADRKALNEFFGWVLNGHRFLWLPWEMGRPVVNYSTLVFIVTLVTGLVWWYPKKWTKATRDKSFKIKWSASLKRVNLDLHNVLGFYSLLILFALACTGVVYGVEWFSKGLYWSTTAGSSLPDWPRYESDITRKGNPANMDLAESLDHAFRFAIARHPGSKGIHVSVPDTTDDKSAVSVTAAPSLGQFYANRFYSFDRYTGAMLPNNELDDRDFSEYSLGQKIRKMNYDIHVGSILGLPGKILAFFASLIGASLPVTGFIIWYNRKWGKKNKAKRPKPEKESNTYSPTPVRRVPVILRAVPKKSGGTDGVDNR